MTLKEAALELAAEGVGVFPVGPDKAPRTSNGFHDATTDPATIEAWEWEAIGATIAPGTFVLDVDPRNGGDKTMALFARWGKELPPTRTVRTKSGGTHHYFTAPEGLHLRGSLGPGVDVKKAGKGYVVAPPSPGYEWVSKGPLQYPPAEAPDWLLEELVVTELGRGADEASEPKFFGFEEGTPYGLAALERELGRLATAREGGRNDALNRAAFSMAQLVAGGELKEEHARDELMRVALLIGLEGDESGATIESGWKAGMDEPRQAPSPGSTEPAPGPAAEGRFWVDWEIDEPDPPFFVHPLLPKNAYVLVYGATEAAKSMAWVGLLSEGSRRGVRSSVYSLENPPHTDRQRLRRWAPDPACFRLTNEPIDFNDPRQVEALIERERGWADVILIDTYSHAFNSRSEDGNAKAIAFARCVRHVMSEVGCSVVVIDHTGFEGDEPRDASAKRQQVDVAVLMRKSGGEWQPGRPAGFTMQNRKAARFANPFFVTGEIRDKDGGLELGWTGTAPRWEPPA